MINWLRIQVQKWRYKRAMAKAIKHRNEGLGCLAAFMAAEYDKFGAPKSRG
jgi:hypothetical protein